ncbi:hypothetical protein [Desulfonatronum parangueonense]
MGEKKTKKIISFEIDSKLALQLESMAYCTCVSRSEFIRNLILKRWDMLSAKIDTRMAIFTLMYEADAK